MSDGRWRTDGDQGYRHERKQAAEWLNLLVSLGLKPSPIERAVMENRTYGPGVTGTSVPDSLREHKQAEAEDVPEDNTKAQEDPEARQTEPHDEPGPDPEAADLGPNETEEG